MALITVEDILYHTSCTSIQGSIATEIPYTSGVHSVQIPSMTTAEAFVLTVSVAERGFLNLKGAPNEATIDIFPADTTGLDVTQYFGIEGYDRSFPIVKAGIYVVSVHGASGYAQEIEFWVPTNAAVQGVADPLGWIPYQWFRTPPCTSGGGVYTSILSSPMYRSLSFVAGSSTYGAYVHTNGPSDRTVKVSMLATGNIVSYDYMYYYGGGSYVAYGYIVPEGEYIITVGEVATASAAALYNYNAYVNVSGYGFEAPVVGPPNGDFSAVTAYWDFNEGEIVGQPYYLKGGTYAIDVVRLDVQKGNVYVMRNVAYSSKAFETVEELGWVFDVYGMPCMFFFLWVGYPSSVTIFCPPSTGSYYWVGGVGGSLSNLESSYLDVYTGGLLDLFGIATGPAAVSVKDLLGASRLYIFEGVRPVDANAEADPECLVTGFDITQWAMQGTDLVGTIEGYGAIYKDTTISWFRIAGSGEDVFGPSTTGIRIDGSLSEIGKGGDIELATTSVLNGGVIQMHSISLTI